MKIIHQAHLSLALALAKNTDMKKTFVILHDVATVVGVEGCLPVTPISITNISHV